jgi:hypothetical protein
VLILMEGEGWLVNILLAATPTPGVFLYNVQNVKKRIEISQNSSGKTCVSY